MTGPTTCCNMIAACRDVTEYRPGDRVDGPRRALVRAGRSSVSGFPGVCRVHRAESWRSRGATGRVPRRGAGARQQPASAAYNAVPPHGRRPLRDRRGKAPAHGRPRWRRGSAGLGPPPWGAARSRRSRSSRLARGQRREAAEQPIDAAVGLDLGPHLALARWLPRCAGRESPSANSSIRPHNGWDRRRVARRPWPATHARRRARPALGSRARGACCWRTAMAQAAPRMCFAPASSGWREVGAPLRSPGRGWSSRRRPHGRRGDDAGADSGAAGRRRRSSSSLGARLDTETRPHARSPPPTPGGQRPNTGAHDLHVHRHRGLDAARLGARRRRLSRPPALARRRAPRHASADTAGGTVVNTTGDGFFVAFRSACPGGRLRPSTSSRRWPSERRDERFRPLSVRIGLHDAVATRPRATGTTAASACTSPRA